MWPELLKSSIKNCKQMTTKMISYCLFYASFFHITHSLVPRYTPSLQKEPSIMKLFMCHYLEKQLQLQNDSSAHSKLATTWMNIPSLAGSDLLRKGVFLHPLCNQYVDHAEVTPHTPRGFPPLPKWEKTSMNLVGYPFWRSGAVSRPDAALWLRVLHCCFLLFCRNVCDKNLASSGTFFRLHRR